MAKVKEPRQKGPELVHRVRAIILRSMDIIDTEAKRKGSRTLAQLIADELIDQPLKLFEAASRVMPKDINIEATHRTVVDLIGEYNQALRKASNQPLTDHVAAHDSSVISDSQVTH